MINGYSIKKENNEDILCLYLDFNSEFANFDFNNKKEEFKETIKNYIKKNKIKFNGTKVAIVVGGIVMVTLLINNQAPLQDNITPTIVEKVENKLEENDSIKEDISNEIVSKEEISNDEQIKEEIKIEQNQKEEIKNNKPQNTQKEEIKQEQNNKKEEIKVEESNKQPEHKEEKKYVTIYRSSGTVLTIELEEYIIGVVGAEMPASFHEEALKAQAIIARTYALKAIENNKVLTDTSSTQNYKDNTQLKKMWGSDYNYYYNKIKNAVEKTKGIYLTYNNQIIEAVYHSTSNGQTESAQFVWGNNFDYLVSVESPYDSTNKSFETDKFLTYEQLSNKLNTTIDSETEFNIISYTDGNRVENIEINGNNYTGVKLRSLLGLRSADFEINKNEEGITFKTKGYGHGVGLSQYGANGMAKNGYTYKQILKHYYQGISINYLN